MEGKEILKIESLKCMVFSFWEDNFLSGTSEFVCFKTNCA